MQVIMRMTDDPMMLGKTTVRRVEEAQVMGLESNKGEGSDKDDHENAAAGIYDDEKYAD